MLTVLWTMLIGMALEGMHEPLQDYVMQSNDFSWEVLTFAWTKTSSDAYTLFGYPNISFWRPVTYIVFNNILSPRGTRLMSGPIV